VKLRQARIAACLGLPGRDHGLLSPESPKRAQAASETVLRYVWRTAPEVLKPSPLYVVNADLDTVAVLQ
jgi:hypothetical protein